MRAEREREVGQDARRLLDLVDAEQQRISDDIHHMLVVLTEMGIGRLDAAACNDTLARIRQRFPPYLAIQTLDRNGVVRCATQPRTIGLSFADRPYFREALDVDEVVSSPYLLSRVSGLPVVSYSRSFRTDDGAPDGVVVILLSVRWLERYLAQTPLPPGATVLIADRSGTVLARVPELPGLSGQPLPERYRPLWEAGAKGVSALTGIDGVTRITAYSPLGVGNRDTFIEVGLDRSVALRRINAAAGRSLLIFAGVLVVAGTGAVWGIGRLVRAQRRAEESALKTARVLASTVDGVVELDRSWRFTYLNDRARALIADGRDVTGRVLWDEFPELVDSPLWDLAHRAMVDGRPVDAEFHGTRTGRWFWMRAFPSDDGMSVYLLDISRRKRAEEALRESNDRLSLALRSAHAGTFEWDLRTGLGHWSEESCRIFGLDPATCAASNAVWVTVVHPDDLEAASLSSRQQLFTERRPDFLLEYRVVHADGSVRWVSTIGRVTYDADGTPLSSRGLNIDVTERQALAEALRRSEERLGIALAAADAGLWDIDLRTGTATWSDGMYRLFGVEPAAFTPTEQSFLGLLHPDDREAVRRTTRAAAEAVQPDYRAEFRILHPREGVRWILGIGRAARDGTGAVIRLSGLNIDITERKAMEQALREAKAKADDANLSKSKFLAAASHDLRQPLQSALLFAGVLQQHLRGTDGAGPLASLERTLETLKDLLDGLLDVSRLEAGVVVPKLEDLALAPFLSRLAASYGPATSGKGLDLRVECDDRGLAVRSDAVLLERMLRNLLENAIRYTPHGHVRLTCAADGRAVRLMVEDSGIGIPPEHLPRVFDAFHQVGNSERDRSQGLGLGLAIVQRLSTLLHHPVTVRSDPGVGSVFTIEVPRAVAPERTGSGTGAAEAGGPGGLAVLIDDDVMVLVGMQSMFRDWGYEVIAAGSAEQAIERLTPVRRVPDIVVADYRLRQGEVGTDAVERVRALVGQRVPGLILTGEIGQDCERAAAAHGLPVVRKPVTPRQLRASVLGLLRRTG
nr:PAS domain-containing protein [Azospirillum oleiclasticum]